MGASAECGPRFGGGAARGAALRLPTAGSMTFEAEGAVEEDALKYLLSVGWDMWARTG